MFEVFKSNLVGFSGSVKEMTSVDNRPLCLMLVGCCEYANKID